MHLRTNIFLWVSLATVVPLTAIVLIATAYSEGLHRSEVDQQMAASLSYLTTEFGRRLAYEQEVIEALAASAPMQGFRPVLLDAAERRRHPEYAERAGQLAGFLAQFQSVLSDMGTIRVLDARGNTLVKVVEGRVAETAFEGMDPYPYADPELPSGRVLAELQGLLPEEASYVPLPPSLNEYGEAEPAPMFDVVVPLQPHEAEVPYGYLLVNSTGVQMDRILEVSPRGNRARLLIAEQNPDSVARDGLMLFDEAAGQLFSGGRGGQRRLSDLFDGQLVQAAKEQPFGALTTRDGLYRLYYTEYLPYPNQLVSWVVALRLPVQDITAPFNRIRLGILVFAAVALLLSLVLAQLGARRVAEPIIQLAGRLEAYGRGERLPAMVDRATDEIRTLGAAFDAMADSLEQAQRERAQAETMLLQSAKLASIGEMAAGIGHEINNPLNNILWLAKLIERGLPLQDDGLRADVRSLTEEANRASRIVRGILDFARQSPPLYTRIGAQAWVQETLALVAQAAREQGVRLRVEAAPGVQLEGDPHQLQQVLVNLLLNAIQASGEGDEIVVQAGTNESGELELCVCDEGSGIAAGIMDKLFDPFFTTKPVGKGSGLGLSVSLGIVQHHGGTLSLRNNERGGVTATIRLPTTRSGNPA